MGFHRSNMPALFFLVCVMFFACPTESLKCTPYDLECYKTAIGCTVVFDISGMTISNETIVERRCSLNIREAKVDKPYCRPEGNRIYCYCTGKDRCNQEESVQDTARVVIMGMIFNPPMDNDVEKTNSTTEKPATLTPASEIPKSSQGPSTTSDSASAASESKEDNKTHSKQRPTSAANGLLFVYLFVVIAGINFLHLS